jgi:hypothetical protein
MERQSGRVGERSSRGRLVSFSDSVTSVLVGGSEICLLDTIKAILERIVMAKSVPVQLKFHNLP